MIKKAILILSILLATPMTGLAQKLTVYRISGKVEVVTPTGRHDLSAREVLSPSSQLDIKYGASVIIFDEQGRKQYTIKTPGRGTVKKMLSEQSTTVINLTERYLRYVKQQLFSKGGIAALSHNSDPATVTRDVEVALADSLAKYAVLPTTSAAPGGTTDNHSGAVAMREKFNQFRRQSTERFDNFRRQCAQRYANFARLAWEEMGLEPPVPRPTEPKFEPIHVNPLPDAELFKGIPIKIDSVVRPTIPNIDMAAVDPFKNVPLMTHKDIGIDWLRFRHFSTDFLLHYPANVQCRLEGVAENFVADVIDQLLQADYDNLLADCLEQRTNLQLCDWAYYQLLKAVGQQLSNGDRDLATVITAFLYAESGYKMRLAIIAGHVEMFVASDHIIYGRSMLTIDGETYIATEALMGSGSAYVCAGPFTEDERPLSLRIGNTPHFGMQETVTPADSTATERRRIASTRYPDLSVEVSVDKGLLEFYDTYPASCVDGNFMTRWALYANTPLAPRVADQIYPTLREYVKRFTAEDAVERLLNLVQMGLTYEYDDKVWGQDRAFFAEESLHYPYCDCEDRAILLTRWVRDLLHLKCALVYYPGHLACAIHFNEDVAGDYITIDDERYIIADPAYLGARLGQTMRGKDNSTATVIVVE